MQEVRVERVSRASFFMMAGAALLLGGRSEAADVCGAQVTVRQIGMTPNEDGTRIVRYRASVETDQPTCAKVGFSIIRSYIKPDGTPFEDAIPVDIQVPGRAVDVEGETLANTRRLIYWRAEKVTCQPCAGGSAANVAAAPVPSSRRAGGTVASREGGGAKVGKKAVLIGGAAVVAGGARPPRRPHPPRPPRPRPRPRPRRPDPPARPCFRARRRRRPRLPRRATSTCSAPIPRTATAWPARAGR
jgi:hypothetical protein